MSEIHVSLKDDVIKPPQEGDLSVWWIPQVPMKSFRVVVRNVQEGAALLHVLGQYDLFQLENNVKPDYSNAGGLEVFEDGEWCGWEDDDGNGIDEYIYHGKKFATGDYADALEREGEG